MARTRDMGPDHRGLKYQNKETGQIFTYKKQNDLEDFEQDNTMISISSRLTMAGEDVN